MLNGRRGHIIGRLTAGLGFFIFLASATLGAVVTTAGKGPLHITGQTPLQTLRLDIVPTRHTILKSRQIEFSLFNSWTNRWNNSPEFLIDIEIIQSIVEIDIGIGNNNEIGISIPIITRTGGNLDRFIIDFHKLMGLDQSGRNEYPRNSMVVRYYYDETGNWVEILNADDQGTVLGDISLYSRSQVYSGDGWLRSLLLTVLFRFPTSSERDYYGSGGTDAAFSLASSHYINPLFLYTTVGYGMFGSGSQFGVDLRPYQWTLFTAIEWPVNRNFSIIVQEMSNSGTAKEYYDFNRPTHELVIGAKQYVSPQFLLEYGVMENLFNFENSVDFGLSFSLTYRF